MGLIVGFVSLIDYECLENLTLFKDKLVITWLTAWSPLAATTPK